MPNPCPIPNAFPVSIHSLCIHLFRCIYLDVFIYLDLGPDADIAGVPLRCPLPADLLQSRGSLKKEPYPS